LVAGWVQVGCRLGVVGARALRRPVGGRWFARSFVRWFVRSICSLVRSRACTSRFGHVTTASASPMAPTVVAVQIELFRRRVEAPPGGVELRDLLEPPAFARQLAAPRHRQGFVPASGAARLPEIAGRAVPSAAVRVVHNHEEERGRRRPDPGRLREEVVLRADGITKVSAELSVRSRHCG
jgi:hypothetical protein